MARAEGDGLDYDLARSRLGVLQAPFGALIRCALAGVACDVDEEREDRVLAAARFGDGSVEEGHGRREWLAGRRAAVIAAYDADAPAYDEHEYPSDVQREWVARALA